MCASVENPDLMCQKIGDSQSLTHSRLAEYGSRQAIQARSDHPNRVVSPSEVFKSVCSRWHQPQIDLFGTRSTTSYLCLCHQYRTPWPGQWVHSACHGRIYLNAYVFPPAAIFGKVVAKLQDYPSRRIILITLEWLNKPWFWDLVAMSGQIPLCLLNLPNLLTQPFNHSSSNEFAKPKPTCVASRASAIKEQGFSEAVAARIEAPQRGSTTSVYEASGPFLQRVPQ